MNSTNFAKSLKAINLAFLCVLTLSFSARAYTPAPIVEVPAGSKLAVKLTSNFNSADCVDGTQIVFKTVEETTCDGSVVLPVDTLITGKIYIPPAVPKNGIKAVRIKLETIDLVGQGQVPFTGTLVARGGLLYVRRDLATVQIAVAGLGQSAPLGTSMCMMSPPSKAWIRKQQLALAKYEETKSKLIAYGAEWGSTVLLSKRNQQIDLREGDVVRIELTDPLRVRKPAVQ